MISHFAISTRRSCRMDTQFLCQIRNRGLYNNQVFFKVANCDLKFSAFTSLNRVNRVMDGLRDWGGVENRPVPGG